MIASAAQLWTDTYDRIAPKHASAFSNSLRCGLALNQPNTSRMDASNDMFSVSWLLTGSGVYKESDKTCALSGGMLVVRRPNHNGVFALDAHALHRRLFVHLDDELAKLFSYMLPEINRLNSVIEQPYDGDLFLQFLSFVEATEKLGDSDPAAVLKNLRSLMFSLFYSRENRFDEAIKAAAQLLATINMNTPLPEIAQRVGIPYGQFRKHFLEMYGMAPGQWRIVRRIERAKQELASGEPIQRVAERLNYADVYAFTHQFKDVAGVTPKTYQLNHID
ncbi:MAG: AraC family transcriptional regulator [Oscillospiraceae bacterium]|jgi:AraC-like DNA-binding protein|nr:AraC family transcriptional regulator [Oscillospiraceae bacterium]